MRKKDSNWFPNLPNMDYPKDYFYWANATIMDGA